MKRLSMILAVTGVAFFCSGSVRAEVSDLNSNIQQITVYPDAARVMRVAKVSLKEGAQTLRIKDIKPTFDEASLTASGSGVASVKILGAKLNTTQLTESADDRIRDLEAKIEGVRDAQARTNADMQILETRKKFLESVRLFSGEQIPKDLMTKTPAAAEMEGTMQFLTTQSQAIEDERQKVNLKVRDLQKQADVLQRQMMDLRGTSFRQQRDILVDVECAKAGDFTLEVAYNVRGVNWRPIYDARVSFEKNEVVLSGYAIINQRSGEDWESVQLVISTSRPSVGGQMPKLFSWYLSPRIEAEAKRRGNGMVYKMAQSKELDMAVQYLADARVGAEDESSLSAPVASALPIEERASVAYAQSASSGVALVYKIAQPVTVKSDGSDIRVPLLTQKLAVKFEYAATPKLSPYAYLRSTVTNGKEEQLMAGRMNIFLDNSYVGASGIDKTIAPEQKFDLFLGVDEGVVVKRELLEEKSDDTFLGSIPSATRKIAYKYKITVENYKPQAIVLSLLDQVPVAKDDKIKVTKIDVSVKPVTEKHDDREGVYLWTLNLQPKEKKEIVLSYVVEYPRDMRVEGL